MLVAHTNFHCGALDMEALPMESSRVAFDLVANCAHDLKTPLVAIFSSNQLTISILSDIQAIIEQMAHPPAGVLNDLEVAKSTLQASLDMTEFMKMSINRCMDFAKVSNHGMKLVPKCETVDIFGALQLPLQCMMTVDPDQIVELEPMPSEMCSHVITDLQWLQENVLCLLSNAGKYSSNGTIDLRVSLSSESALQVPERLSAARELASTEGQYEREPTMPKPLKPSTRTPLTGAYSNITGFSSVCADPQDRQMVVVECEDSGIGLSEDAMANLFAPFQQAQRMAGGTGLGLFSLANRMEALHGQCGVRGRRDGAQGSLFWFAFPYKPDEEAAEVAHEVADEAAVLTTERLAEHLARSASSDPGGDGLFRSHSTMAGFGQGLVVNTIGLLPYGAVDPLSPTHRGGVVTPRAARQLAVRIPPAPAMLNPRTCSPVPQLRKGSAASIMSSPAGSSHSFRTSIDSASLDHALHILLVDDTPSILKICTRTLQREGFRVSTAENGYEALKLMNQAKFDAVLMDLQMPVLDGLETVRRFRATEAVPEGRRRQFIVAVSASADPTIAQHVMDVGFDGFIEKPFSIKVLQAIMPYDIGIAARIRDM